MRRNQILTADEVAALLRCSRRALYQRLQRDPASIPGVVRLGRRLLFRTEAIESWLRVRVLFPPQDED